MKKIHLPEVGHGGRKWTLGGNVRRVSWVMVHLQEQESGYKDQSHSRKTSLHRAARLPPRAVHRQVCLTSPRALRDIQLSKSFSLAIMLQRRAQQNGANTSLYEQCCSAHTETQLGVGGQLPPTPRYTEASQNWGLVGSK